MDDEDVRLAVYQGFAATGRAPTRADLAVAVGADADALAASLRRLHDARHVVLDDDGAIVMAHPFAAVPLGFAVMGRDTLWWGGCAWDAFALPHLLRDEPDVLVATRCPACGAPHAWNVGRDTPPAGDQVAHLLVPVARIWDDVVHTCRHQRLFCGTSCIDDWLERERRERGAVLDLAALWRLAAHWYDGRLDRGYVRRDPSTARDYFREVGLDGPFWDPDAA